VIESVNRQKKKFSYFAIATGIIIIFLLTLVLLSPRFINVEAVKEKIVASVSQKLKGNVDVQKVDISFFPRPHVIIHQARLSLRGKTRGTIESLRVYPEILPLLGGKVRIAKIHAESPEFSLSIPEDELLPKAETGKKDLTILKDLPLDVSDLVIVIKKGKLDLYENNQILLPLQNIDSRIVFPPEELKISVSFTSNFSKNILFILRRFVKDEVFLKEIDNIKDIKGSVQGRLVLDGSIASIKPHVDISEFNISASYQRTPYPLTIRGGHFSSDGKKIHINNLSGTLGKSSFSGLTAQLTLGNSPHFDITSGKSFILLEDIHRWLSSYNKLKTSLKDISSIKGAVTLSSINLTGPLYHPQDWRFRGMGSAENISISSPLLPGPVNVTGKKFEVTEDYLTFTDVQTSMLDASYKISGDLRDTLRGLQNADIAFNGSIGPKAAQWLKDSTKLAPVLIVNKRFTFSDSHLIWEKSGNVFFQGNIKVQNGPDIFIDLLKNRSGLKINKLVIDEGTTHATLEFTLQENVLGLSFIGKVHGSTLEKLINLSHIPGGSVQGNFRTDINLEKPSGIIAQGNLSAENVVIPWKEKVPIKIENISLDADTNQFKIESALIRLGTNAFSLGGNLNSTEKGIMVDMELAADRIEWEPIRKLMEKDSEDRNTTKKDNAWLPPLHGILRLKSNNFIYDKITASPLHADITFSPDLTTVTVTNASVCGISTPGIVKILHDTVQLDFKPISHGQELKPTLNCFTDKKSVITGRFDFSSTITAHGKSDQLLRSLEGKLDLRARDGRIYQAATLAKIFSLLNVTGIFKGNIPDLTKEGFSYQSFILRGNVENGIISLDEAIINAPTMEIVGTGDIDLVTEKMNIKILVAPLKTIDSVLEKIPLVRDITGRNLVSIPIKVSGDLENPEVSYLPVSDVGSGLLGIMERTIKLPVKVIQPLIPKEKKKEHDTSKD